MSKLYLFGIGGTGSRVIRSLTMLLASGVDAGVDTIVPVLIDPDLSNGDLTRTVNLLKNIRKYILSYLLVQKFSLVFSRQILMTKARISDCR